MVSVVGRCCNLVNTQVPGAPVLRRTGAGVHSTLTRPARSEVSLVLTTPGVTAGCDRSRAAPVSAPGIRGLGVREPVSSDSRDGPRAQVSVSGVTSLCALVSGLLSPPPASPDTDPCVTTINLERNIMNYKKSLNT